MRCVHGAGMDDRCEACVNVNRQANQEALAALKASYRPPERCPVCDRAAADCARFRLFPWAGRLDGTDDSVGDARYECYQHEVDWRAVARAALASAGDAAKWQKVAPLIERLRTAMVGVYGIGDAPLQEYRQLAAAADALLAVDVTP